MIRVCPHRWTPDSFSLPTVPASGSNSRRVSSFEYVQNYNGRDKRVTVYVLDKGIGNYGFWPAIVKMNVAAARQLLKVLRGELKTGGDDAERRK